MTEVPGIVPKEDYGDPNHKQAAWNPAMISASRVESYLQCGVAFKMHYLDGIPEQRSGSAALFGNVLHKALEDWTLDRTQDLVSLTAAAWFHETRRDPQVQAFIRAYQGISAECMKAEAEAVEVWQSKNPGKVSKAPRMTAVFKSSDAAIKLGRLLGEWIPRLDHSHWQFTERDPLPGLYDESLKVARAYASKYRDRPKSLVTEFGFLVEWNGFHLRGYIDCIDPLLSDTGELVGYMITDYKTYKNEPPPMKDWRQGVMYDVAVRDLIERGVIDLDPLVPRYTVFDYVRLLQRKDFKISPEDRGKLMEELNAYERGVKHEVFLPAQKGSNPDFCAYPENCCLNTRGDGIGLSGGIYR